jgi:HD-GYP domain-containing protein (c-di-GMP phosphodiesterase class II)
VGQHLKKLHISRQSGVAGYIFRTGKPVVVNDPGKNRHFYQSIDDATGFKTRCIIGAPIVIDKEIVGVIEALNKRDGADFNRRDMRIMQGLARTIGIALDDARQNRDLLDSYKGTVKALVSLADTKEGSGGGHSRRVTEYAMMAARELQFSDSEKQILEYAAMLHDIGKLSIPDGILNKVEEPTEAEWQIIRRHPMVGYELMKDIPCIREASRLVLYHHERFDGEGYPEGLKGEDIPMGARIIAVADAFDYMTNPHPYRRAITREMAFAELLQQSGTHFCPTAVKAFNAAYIRSKLLKVRQRLG